MRRPRPAFALVSVLWVLALAGGVTLAAAVEGRLGVDAARHRIAHDRGLWTARGCLAVARAKAAERLSSVPEGERQAERWRELGREVAALPRITAAGCVVLAEPSGVRVGVNEADSAALERLVSALAPGTRAGTVVGTLLAHRPFESVEALRAVPGVPEVPGLLASLDVEPSRIALLHAPGPVLASLPGFTPEGVAYLLHRRTAGPPIHDLHDLVSGAPHRARARLEGAFASLSERATVEPIDWRVVARVQEPGLAPVVVEQLLRRSSASTIVTRERSW